jgi:cytochrome b
MTSSAPNNEGGEQRVKVWDWPTRLFHWLLVLHIPILWFTAEEEMMDAHRAAGSVVAGLIVFRIIWGFIGSSTARFENFVRGPRRVLAYLRGHAPDALGHNPLGGWSILAMLALLVFQVLFGLFATDVNGLESGPLAIHVSFETARLAAECHEMTFNFLLVMIIVHVTAILFYAVVRKRNLVTPMLTGKMAAAYAEPLREASLRKLAIALAIGMAATAWLNL